MSKILVKSDFNYADEFDLRGGFVTDRDTWETHMVEAEAFFAALKAKKYRPQEENEPDWRYKRAMEVSVEIYFGTNEQLTFNSFDEYKRGFTVQDISGEEAAVIVKYFGNSIGEFQMLDEMEPEYYD